MSRPVRRDRAVARLAAVQALYQMETAGTGVEAVIREFLDHRFETDIEGRRLAPGDEAFFAELTRGVVSEQAAVDQAIRLRLADGWRMSRLDATARAILRCGAYELMRRPEIPTEIVIDEYLEVAKSFFDGPEPAFINGLLDSLAHGERAA